MGWLFLVYGRFPYGVGLFAILLAKLRGIASIPNAKKLIQHSIYYPFVKLVYIQLHKTKKREQIIFLSLALQNAQYKFQQQQQGHHKFATM